MSKGYRLQISLILYNNHSVLNLLNDTAFMKSIIYANQITIPNEK